MAAAIAVMGLLSIGQKSVSPIGARLNQYADLLLETLDERQTAELMMPFDSPKRPGWHFVPKDDRKGVPLAEMNDASRAATLRLVRGMLSKSGYGKVDQIRMLEGVVAELEGKDRRWARDPNLYYLTLFGKPSPDQRWGLSFEGHHVSLNFVCRGDEVLDSTPQFLGTHPARVPDDYSGAVMPGTRVLADEEDLAFELVQSLTAEQTADAVIAKEPPPEVRFAGDAQPDVDDAPEGLAFSAMNRNQRSLLKQLIQTHVNVAATPVARSRIDRIETAGWDDIHFAWAGAKRPGVGHYYKIRGAGMLIEFINVQPDALGNPANHAHTVLRDLTGDFDLPLP